MKKIQLNTYLFPSFFFLMFLLMQVETSADNLGGKYFPEDSPFLGTFYPNNFLLWGMLIFLSAGWLLVSYLFNFKKEIHRGLAVLFFTFLGFFATLYFENSLEVIHNGNNGHWASLLYELIEAWGRSWILGCLWAFNVYKIESKKEGIGS